MATRLYLPPSGGTPGITPNPSTSWEFTTGFARVVPSLTKNNVAGATKAVADTTATTDRDGLAYQYVYPLPTGVVFATTDTFKGQVMWQETATTANLSAQMMVRVLASDGTTVRATLYAGDTQTGAANPTNEFSTTLTNREIVNVAPVACAANYTTVAGDYLVIEVGCRKRANASTTGNIRVSTATAETDLAADSNTGTVAGASWFETSGSLSAPSTIVTATPTDLGMGSTAAAVQSGASVVSTKSDLGMGSTSATVGLGANVAATKSDLGLGSTAAAVQSSASAITTKSDLGMGSTSAVAGAGSNVAASKSDLGLGSTAAAVQAGVRVISTTSDLGLSGLAAIVRADALVITSAADLGLGSSAAIVGIGALVPATTTDLGLGSSSATVLADALVLAIAEGLILGGSSGIVTAGALVLAAASDLALSGSVATIDEPGGTVSVTVVATAGDLGLGSTEGIAKSGALVLVTPGTMDLAGSTGSAVASVVVLGIAGDLWFGSTLAHVLSGDVVIVIVPIVSGVAEGADILRAVARRQHAVARADTKRLIAS